MFRCLLVLCSSLLLCSKASNWCSNRLFDSVLKCLQLPNCRLRHFAPPGEYMSSDQFVMAKFGCRESCSSLANCNPKPWDLLDKKIRHTRQFSKCMKRCKYFPFKDGRQKLPCSDECLDNFKKLRGLDSSEEIILENVDLK